MRFVFFSHFFLFLLQNEPSYECLTLSSTDHLPEMYSWDDKEEVEKIEPKSQEIIEDHSFFVELPPSSSKQRCDPEPVEPGFYRMELSVDMIQKLTNLFGIFPLFM